MQSPPGRMWNFSYIFAKRDTMVLNKFVESKHSFLFTSSELKPQLLHAPALLHLDYSVRGGPQCQCRWTPRLPFHSRGLIISQAT